MLNRVLGTIEKDDQIKRDDKVVVGISGGPDSVCLLHVLNGLSERLGMKLYAVHINHMLRGLEADNDQRFVEGFCKKLGVPLYSYVVDVGGIAKERNISVEEAGREVRYGKFEELAARLDAQCIAVAHNRNDQVETVLMNMIRGAGLEGLKGIEYRRGKIVRPLLDISRKDIEEYCRKFDLRPRQDSSNKEALYTRNKIRLKLIPYINDLFGLKIENNLYRTSLLLKDDYDFVQKSAEERYTGCIAEREPNSISLDIKKLNSMHVAMERMVLREAIKNVKGNLKEIENVHIENALELCKTGRNGSILHLPCGLRVIRSYEVFKIFIPDEHENGQRLDFEYEVAVPGITYADEPGILLKSSIEKKAFNIEQYSNIRYNSLVQVFDYDLLFGGINLRDRKQGDIFRPLKSPGTKKLKEYLIDIKMPRDQRYKVPLMAVGNEIVWIVGYKISDKFKVTENTRNVLKIICTRQDGEGRGG